MSKLSFFAAPLCLALTLCLAPVLSGCTGHGGSMSGNKTAVTQQDLQHHNYTLVTINGKEYTGERVPSIEFNEGFRASGSMCNGYTGKAELTDNVLTIKQMASTKMLCVDPVLNQLEADFSTMMMEGANISLQNNMLTLSRDDLSLVFKLRDYVN